MSLWIALGPALASIGALALVVGAAVWVLHGR